jgi:acetyl esterase/lipase
VRERVLSLIIVSLIAVPALTSAIERSPAIQQIPAASPSGSATVTIQENVVYATVGGSDLHLDVYEPADLHDEISPAVVLIHGGGWTGFDKSTMRGMGQLLARSGFVGFSVDYRLFKVGEDRWPAQLDDVQRGVRWIRANATSYKVNPRRIGDFGHSAGAQLAALLAMEETTDNSDPAFARYASKVQAVADVSGPTGFRTERDPEGIAFLTAFLGADYAKDPEVWQQASPALRVETFLAGGPQT